MRLNSWDQEMNYDESLSFLHKLSWKIAPEAFRQRYPSFPWGDVAGLLDYNFDYSELPVADAIVLRQYHALFRKFEPLKGFGSKETRAWDTFRESETLCAQTNCAIRSMKAGSYYFLLPGAHDIIYRAQRKISQILGPVPSLETLRLRFGPGATTLLKKQCASWSSKLSSSLACSEPLIPYLTEVLYELPHMLPFEGDEGVVSVEIHNGRLQFVPKDAKTYRAIVIEPPLNLMVQLGIGDYMSERLRVSGVDLKDQTVNQRLAQLGSLTGDLATLDLSSASDTVSTELVSWLLPSDWFTFLSRYRSNKVDYVDESGCAHTLRLEKFSSMGNGFNFPLETLIFYALTWAVCHNSAGRVNAYGDDIICPSEKFTEVCNILTMCGFLPNRKKSFASGPFRESCGADYLCGINIRPLYIKNLIKTSDLFVIHNFFARQYETDISSFILSFIDPVLQIWGPDGYGDGHLVGKWTGRPHKRDSGHAGYVFDTYAAVPNLQVRPTPGDRVLPVYSIYVRYDGNSRVPSYDGSWSPVGGLPLYRGEPRSTLPGDRGYRRISIYTLIRPDIIM